jgi:phosphoribosyl 1,2-cyclic phosphate phosphodiesterase
MTQTQSIRVTILGCGSSPGVPVIGCDCRVCTGIDPLNQRTRASVAISIRAESQHAQHAVFDTGPEFRIQLLREKISHLEHVIYTHTHSDHCAGFDDLRALFFRARHPLAIHGTSAHIADLKQRFPYVFESTGYHGTAPDLTVHTITPGQSFKILGIDAEATSVDHGNQQVTVFRIGGLVYATDFKSLPEDLITRWRGKVHTMVASGLRMTTHPTHSSLPETVALIKKIEAKQGIITHLGHEIDYHEISRTLPANIRLAFDGLSVECPVVL